MEENLEVVEKKSFKPGYLPSLLADGDVAKHRVGSLPDSLILLGRAVPESLH